MRLTVVLAFCCSLAAQPETVLDDAHVASVTQFQERGSFEDVLSKLAVQIRPVVLVGFLKAEGSGQKITVSVDHATVGDVLRRMCLQDKRYRIVTGTSPHVVNILPQEPGSRGMELLRVRLAQFDMVTDDWPQNLHMRVVEFSPSLSAYLHKWYQLESPLKAPAGSPGANMAGTVSPPRVEIHLKNASVLEVMNAVSEWTLRLSSAKDGSVPPDMTIWPVGWRCQIPQTDQFTFEFWSHAIFSAFPQ
jgi:hypothetical protein